MGIWLALILMKVEGKDCKKAASELWLPPDLSVTVRKCGSLQLSQKCRPLLLDQPNIEYLTKMGRKQMTNIENWRLYAWQPQSINILNDECTIQRTEEHASVCPVGLSFFLNRLFCSERFFWNWRNLFCDLDEEGLSFGRKNQNKTPDCNSFPLASVAELSSLF